MLNSTQNTYLISKFFRIRIFMCLLFIQMNKIVGYLKLVYSPLAKFKKLVYLNFSKIKSLMCLLVVKFLRK